MNSIRYVYHYSGLALTYILENSFKAEHGSRPGVPKVGILITDGKSQDDVISPAESLKEAGIELFAIGETRGAAGSHRHASGLRLEMPAVRPHCWAVTYVVKPCFVLADTFG